MEDRDSYFVGRANLGVVSWILVFWQLFKKKEHQLREKEKQKELEKRNKLKNQQEKINQEKREKINQEKREGEIKKNKIKNILDNYFLTNTDVSITFDNIVKLFYRYKIKYKGKLGQFLEEHLSTDYYKIVKIKNRPYVQKIKRNIQMVIDED